MRVILLTLAVIIVLYFYASQASTEYRWPASNNPPQSVYSGDAAGATEVALEAEVSPC